MMKANIYSVPEGWEIYIYGTRQDLHDFAEAIEAEHICLTSIGGSLEDESAWKSTIMVYYEKPAPSAVPPED